MPRHGAKVINCSGATKRRLTELRGPHFGASEEAVLQTLLSLAEAARATLHLQPDAAASALDKREGIPASNG